MAGGACLHRRYVLYHSDSDSLGNEPFTGTPDEIKAEAARLQAITDDVKGRLAKLGPAPSTIPYIKQVRPCQCQRDALLYSCAMRGGCVLAKSCGVG